MKPYLPTCISCTKTMKTKITHDFLKNKIIQTTNNKFLLTFSKAHLLYLLHRLRLVLDVFRFNNFPHIQFGNDKIKPHYSEELYALFELKTSHSHPYSLIASLDWNSKTYREREPNFYVEKPRALILYQ